MAFCRRILLLPLFFWAAELRIDHEEGTWTRNTWDEFMIRRPKSRWHVLNDDLVIKHAQILSQLGYDAVTVVGPDYRFLGGDRGPPSEWFTEALGNVQESFMAYACQMLVETVWNVFIDNICYRVYLTHAQMVWELADACESAQKELASLFMLKEQPSSEESKGFALRHRPMGTLASAEEKEKILHACLQLVKWRGDEMMQALASSGLVYKSLVTSFYTENKIRLEANNQEVCEDQHSNCEFWADEGECQANPYYMQTRCPLSCGICKSLDGYERLGNYWFLPSQVQNLSLSAWEEGRLAVDRACPSALAQGSIHLLPNRVQIVQHHPPSLLKEGNLVHKQLHNLLAGKCAYINLGWWTYEICFNSRIRQIHYKADGTILKQNSLGTLRAASFGHVFTREQIQMMGMQGDARPFVLQEYAEGEACNTGTMTVLRKSTLRITCGFEYQNQLSSDRAHLVLVEPIICEYVFTLFWGDMCGIGNILDDAPKQEL